MTNGIKKLGRTVFAVAVVATCIAGLTATATTAEAKRPGGGYHCPDVWQPVICADGNIYSNFCYASLAGATGCVLWGGDIY